MCSGSKRKICNSTDIVAMESLGLENQQGLISSLSVLLEFAASDDFNSFKFAVEQEGRDVNEGGLWYGRKIGSKKMRFDERTPLMIAAMFGSVQVLSYILDKGCVDVNKVCGSDRVTALHCAVVGGSAASHEVVKLLLDACADVNCVDAHGNRPADLIGSVQFSSFRSRRKVLEQLLKGSASSLHEECQLIDLMVEEQPISTPMASRDGADKKEYPVDPSLPDIKNGIYGTDEFRMYTFKVKPCSRAYSHDWTECPFVHPGENARRRDPKKYHYSCVPCPEFRKGTCQRGDACEYAHGIFECWLHPAQYRTRLCKDETNCNRRVCFFAHKPEELRPLYASTGSAVPSPRSFPNGASSLDLTSLSPLALGSPSMMIPPTSTPPMTPTGVSSPMGGSIWPNQMNLVPPTLQLPGSRLKTGRNARDMDFDAEILGLESNHRRQQQLMDDISSSSPSGWSNSLASAAAFAALSNDRSGEFNRSSGVKPTNFDDVFRTLDCAILSQLQGLSIDAGTTQMQSPNGIQMHQNINQQMRTSYSSGLSSSPVRASSPFGVDPLGAAAAVLNSRSAAFARRSQSFIDRGAVKRHSEISSASAMPPSLSDWGSPGGKLDWGIQKEELNKLRKSASFGFRSNGSSPAATASPMRATLDEPDVSWVQSLVKDAPPANSGQHGFEDEQNNQYHPNSGVSELMSQWVDQLYMEQEQTVA